MFIYPIEPEKGKSSPSPPSSPSSPDPPSSVDKKRKQTTRLPIIMCALVLVCFKNRTGIIMYFIYLCLMHKLR